MKIGLTIGFILMLIANHCRSIPFYYNEIDSSGRKQGFWRECNDWGCTDSYYVNDTINGVFKAYYYNGKQLYLSMFGSYKMGQPCGIWYYFDTTGHLTIEESKIKVIHIRKQDTVYKGYTSYVKEFYENGFCKDEGNVQYIEDIQVDFIKIGTWKHYDKEGNFIK